MKESKRNPGDDVKCYHSWEGELQSTRASSRRLVSKKSVRVTDNSDSWLLSLHCKLCWHSTQAGVWIIPVKKDGPTRVTTHSRRLSFKRDLLHTSYFQKTVEHRKRSAKMRLCLKDNKQRLVSSGHFLRTDRLVHTRHLVHVANGRYDTLHLIPRPLQSSPSVGPT